MDVELVNNYNNNYLDSIYSTYKSVGWLNHNKESIKELMNNSTHITLAVYNNEVIGLGRALSDGIFNAAIYDVVVKNEFQNMKIGSKILNNLLDRIGDVSCIHLISTTGNIDFYRSQGFRKLKTGMVIYQSDKLINEYTE